MVVAKWEVVILAGLREYLQDAEQLDFPITIGDP